MLHHPQSARRRHRARPAASRLQGAGLDQRGLCLDHRPRRQQGYGGRCLQPSHRDLRGRRYPRQRRFRGRLCARAGQGRSECRARGEDRRRRPLDRRFYGRRRKAVVRSRAGDRTHQGGAQGDRRRQFRRPAHRPLRSVSARAEGFESGDRPAHGLRRGRRRLSLRAGHFNQGRNFRRCEGRASKARQFALLRQPIIRLRMQLRSACAASASVARCRGRPGSAS